MPQIFTEVFDFLDKFTIFVSSISMIFSLLVWIKLQEQKKFDNQRIQIKIVVPETEKYIALWHKPERKHLTRAEVLGLIALIPRTSHEHYKIAFLNTQAFFQHLAKVQDEGNNTVLSIECTEAELQQFNLQQVREQCEYFGF